MPIHPSGPVLVVGATGFLGGEICRQLCAQARAVQALARTTSDGARVAALRAAGAEMVTGDLRDLASLEAACHGCTDVISTASAMPFSYGPDNTLDRVDGEGQQRLIDAARQAGVGHFVLVSVSGNCGDDIPLIRAKRATERHLRTSGLTFTILRPSVFMEAWLSPLAGFDAANAAARVYGPGEAGISWITMADVAQFAIASLDHPAARDAVIELGGTEVLSQRQVVRIFEEVGGRPFALQQVPEEALRAQQEAAADAMAQSFAGLMGQLARGDRVPMEGTLRTFPIRMTTVREYAERSLHQ